MPSSSRSYTKSLTDVTFDALAVGVMMATVMMVAQAICKLALGVAADKNAKLSFIAAFVTGVAGVLLVWFGTGSEIMLYAGAAIYGFFFAACVVFGSRYRSSNLRQSRVSRHLFPYQHVREHHGCCRTGVLGIPRRLLFTPFCSPSPSLLLVVVLLLGLYSFSKAKTVQDRWTE